MAVVWCFQFRVMTIIIPKFRFGFNVESLHFLTKFDVFLLCETVHSKTTSNVVPVVSCVIRPQY